jgi:hypothetical protein
VLSGIQRNHGEREREGNKEAGWAGLACAAARVKIIILMEYVVLIPELKSPYSSMLVCNSSSFVK